MLHRPRVSDITKSRSVVILRGQKEQQVHPYDPTHVSHESEWAADYQSYRAVTSLEASLIAGKLRADAASEGFLNALFVWDGDAKSRSSVPPSPAA